MMWRRNIAIVVLLLIGFQIYAQRSKDSIEFANYYYDALRYLAIDNKDMALQNLEQCTKLVRKDASSLYLQGKILAEKSRFDNAEIFFRKAYSIDPSNEWYLKALARVYLELGKNDDAYGLYLEKLKNDPNNQTLRLSLAQMYEGSNQYGKALEHYLKYCDLAGAPKKELLKCVRLQYELSKFSEADNTLGKLLSRNRTDYKLWILRTDLLLQQKKYDHAQMYFDSMLVNFPDIADVKYTYAEFLLLNQDHNKLRGILNLVLEDTSIGVSKKIALLSKILNHQQIRFSDEEITELVDILVAVHPDSYDVNFIAGSFKLDSGKYTEAAKLLSTARKINPNNLKIWLMELVALNFTRSYERINEVADSAQLLYPNFPEPYFYKGLSALHLKKHDLAIENLETGKELILDNKQLLQDFQNLQAETYYDNKEYNKSFEIYEEILSHDPTNEVVKNNYSYFLSEQNKNLKRAEELMLQNLKKSPKDHKYLDTYAWILFKDNRLKISLKYIELSIANGGNYSAVIQEHYGDILTALQLKERALDAYKAALKLAPHNKMLQEKIQQLKK